MRRLLPVLAFAVAALLGWWIAPPAPVSQLGDEPGLGNLAGLPGADENAELANHLETIYQRGVWSSRNPVELSEQAEEGSDTEAEAAPAPPEGLDRFRLVGVIRVGNQAEALLLDEGLSEEEAGELPRVVRAAPGDQLNNTGVTLARIESRRARLALGEEARWIDLYPDYRSFANEPND